MFTEVANLITDADAKKSILDSLSSGKENLRRAVELLLLYISNEVKEKVFVFADLSRITSVEGTSEFIRILKTYMMRYNILFPTSSGADYLVLEQERNLVATYNTFMSSFRSLTIKAFTEEEAIQYLKMQEASFDLNEVRHFIGTNPLV